MAQVFDDLSGSAQKMNAADYAKLQWDTEEELARERAIQQARNYYAGAQTTYLSNRLREILDLNGAPNVDQLFHLNICDKIISAIVERLHVTAFSSEDTALSDWAWQTWDDNRADAMEWTIYEGVRRDGEYFVLVDLDEDGDPRLTPHQRYVDSFVGGDGYGCRAYYPNDDPTQEMTHAIKRWLGDDADGKPQKRMTIYYPDHIEKYRWANGWELTLDDGDSPDENGFVPWVDAQGEPLGIPVMHFINRNFRCEIDQSVVSMQNLLNKTLIDLAESADQAAFRVWLAFGFMPTSDGKPLAADRSNRAKIQPNALLGTTKPPSEASMTAIPGESPMPLIDLIERVMKWVAQAKDIPLSRLQFTGQVASAQTQKQQDAPLLAVCRQLQISLGNSWEDCFYMARRLTNVYGGETFDEEATLQTQWASPDVRTDDRDDPGTFWNAANQAVAAGVPIETYLRRMGWTDADLQDLYENASEDQQIADNRPQTVDGAQGGQANNDGAAMSAEMQGALKQNGMPQPGMMLNANG